MKFQTHVALQVTATYEIEVGDDGGIRVVETTDPSTSLAMPLFGEGAHQLDKEQQDAIKNTACSMVLLRTVASFLSRLPSDARARLLSTAEAPVETKANA